ncbi:MAG: response regulator transcription factor [Sphingobacteriaceae bacterium]|nr:response regulator transcription factor [Cytophagaceae bacterium]
MPLRLLIADDHPLLVNGVSAVLAELPGVELLEPVENGRQLLDRLHKIPVDLVLLDLNMPKLDGIAALKTLKNEFPQTKVIVFTSYDQPKLIREIRALGAEGYLLKNSPAPVLKQAIATVAAGGTWFAEEQPGAVTPPGLVDDFMRKYGLTTREVEIIRLVGRGLTTRVIAERLFVSEFTVNAHRRNICRKVGVDTPVGLLNFAREQGLA